MDGVDLVGRLLDPVARPGLLLDRPGEQPERRLSLVGQRLALDERLDVLERLTLARPPFDGRPKAAKSGSCTVWTSSPAAGWGQRDMVLLRASACILKSADEPPPAATRTRRTAASPSDVLVGECRERSLACAGVQQAGVSVDPRRPQASTGRTDREAALQAGSRALAEAEGFEPRWTERPTPLPRPCGLARARPTAARTSERARRRQRLSRWKGRGPAVRERAIGYRLAPPSASKAEARGCAR